MISFKRSLEILLARVVPGVFSVIALIMLASRMDPADYGLFSALLATSGLLSNIFFGPLAMSIVPSHSSEREGLERARFEGAIVGSCIAVSLFVLFLGLIGRAFYSNAFSIALLVMSLGVSSCLLPILQARLDFWRYGAAAGIQALLVLMLLFVIEDIETGLALYIFSSSYILSSLLSYAFLGYPNIQLPSSKNIKVFAKIGLPLTVSTLSESTLFVGFRYAFMAVGDQAAFGLFSLLVDLAQRGVAVVVNIVSFAILPHAYRESAEGKDKEFIHLLLVGSGISLAFSIVMAFLIWFIGEIGLLGGIRKGEFPIVMFSLVCAGVVVNRVRKILLDPVAIRDAKAFAIPVGYFFGGSSALVLGLLFLHNSMYGAFYFSYAGGYWLAAGITGSVIGGFIRLRR